MSAVFTASCFRSWAQPCLFKVNFQVTPIHAAEAARRAGSIGIRVQASLKPAEGDPNSVWPSKVGLGVGN